MGTHRQLGFLCGDDSVHFLVVEPDLSSPAESGIDTHLLCLANLWENGNPQRKLLKSMMLELFSSNWE